VIGVFQGQVRDGFAVKRRVEGELIVERRVERALVSRHRPIGRKHEVEGGRVVRGIFGGDHAVWCGGHGSRWDGATAREDAQ